MNGRAPAARWVATFTAIAVVAVLIALAIRMKLGGDPAIGAASAGSTTSPRSDDGGGGGAAVQDLLDEGSSPQDSSPPAVPSAPPTSRAS